VFLFPRRITVLGLAPASSASNVRTVAAKLRFQPHRSGRCHAISGAIAGYANTAEQQLWSTMFYLGKEEHALGEIG
jgi:hypothetical protein